MCDGSGGLLSSAQMKPHLRTSQICGRNKLVVVKVDSLVKELMGVLSAGGGGAAEHGVHPGQSDLPQEVPRPRGGKHAGEEDSALAAYPVL